VNIDSALADTARLLGRRPQQAGDLDQDALAQLDKLGLVATDSRGYVRLNVTQAPGSAISALARGDFARTKAYARPRLGH
jgi:hypothetical protein